MKFLRYSHGVFISYGQGDEYSEAKPTYPPGKWFFYEQILRVPIYALFEPCTGRLQIIS